MKIIADQNMPMLTETFGRHGQLLRLNGRNIDRSQLANADVLLVRSVTRVNRELLEGTKIRFVGSATIGIDHIDTKFLESHNIPWAHAPGCNADAAAQYSLAMMWLACERLGRDFLRQKVGIIGRGNVGSRLQELLKCLEIPVVCCDPPLQDQGMRQLVTMDEACECNIISLHVPLTTTGNYPTKHLLGRDRLANIAPGTLLVNAARSEVIDSQCLHSSLRSGRLHAALDVWPDEPRINTGLLDLVTVATPHVAGYSNMGKRSGSAMIYRAFCDAFSLHPAAGKTDNGNIMDLEFPGTVHTQDLLSLSIQASCQIARDDAALRALAQLLPAKDNVQIDRLRKNYPERYEFASYRVRTIDQASARMLRGLGFNLTST